MNRKTFNLYKDAYELYSGIASGREPDRKNASIFYVASTYDTSYSPSKYIEPYYVVEWQTKII